MATNYPGSLDTGTEQPSPSASTEMDDAGFEHDVVHTNHSEAIIALETKVGTGSSSAVADSVLAGTGSGTSGWSTAPSLAGLTVDTDTLHVDATNDRVGIGTTSPANPLHIKEDSYGLLSLDRTANANVDQQVVLAPTYQGANNTALDFNIGSTIMRLTEAGNVGIGTTSPGQALQVEGRIVANHTGNAFPLSVQSDQSTSGIILTDAGTTSNVVLRSNSNDFQIRTSGANRVTVDSSGKVGIGTTSPAGEFELTANTPEMIFSSSPNKTNRYRFDANFTDSADFGFSMGYWTGSAWVRAVTLLDNGRVGIGTTSPAANLHVASTVTDFTLQDTNGTKGGSMTARMNITDSAGALQGRIGCSATGSGVMIVDNNDGPLLLRTLSNDNVNLVTNGVTRVYVKGDGRVGIGTSTPDHVLELGQISGEPDLLRCWNNNGSEGFRVAASVVRSSTIANTTTSSSANVFVSTSSNTLFRSTVSALKYKTNVETMEDSYADAILGLRPVWYRSRCELDPESYGYWGFIAEEVAEIDPRLVTFGVADDYEWQYDEDDEKIEPDVADLTEPEGVQYDRLVPHLVNLLARQRDQIVDLSSRVTALEAA